MFQRDVARGVHWIKDGYVNWFIVSEGSDLTVVDAGMTNSWPSLISALKQLGRTLSDVKAVVLTHAHFDHVGIAERLRVERGLPVYVHELDAPLCRHPLTYDHETSTLRYVWRPTTLKVLTSFTAWGMWSTKPVESVKTYQDNDVLDVPGHPRIIFTPGHTYGHSSLQFADRNVLIAGDAIVETDPYTQKPGPRIVCRAATANVEQNLQSLDRIKSLSAQIILTGHGRPITSGCASAVEVAGQLPVT